MAETRYIYKNKTTGETKNSRTKLGADWELVREVKVGQFTNIKTS